MKSKIVSVSLLLTLLTITFLLLATTKPSQKEIGNYTINPDGSFFCPDVSETYVVSNFMYDNLRKDILYIFKNGDRGCAYFESLIETKNGRIKVSFEKFPTVFVFSDDDSEEDIFIKLVGEDIFFGNHIIYDGINLEVYNTYTGRYNDKKDINYLNHFFAVI